MIPALIGIGAAGLALRVAATLGYDHAELAGASRTRPLTQHRQVAMTVIRRVLGTSYPEIGRVYCRDHTTVMHAVHRVDTDERWSRLADRVMAAVGCPSAETWTT